MTGARLWLGYVKSYVIIKQDRKQTKEEAFKKIICVWKTSGEKRARFRESCYSMKGQRSEFTIKVSEKSLVLALTQTNLFHELVLKD